MLRRARVANTLHRYATMTLYPSGGARGPVILPAFKAGDSALRGSNGGFDSHTLPPPHRLQFDRAGTLFGRRTVTQRWFLFSRVLIEELTRRLLEWTKPLLFDELYVTQSRACLRDLLKSFARHFLEAIHR